MQLHYNLILQVQFVLQVVQTQYVVKTVCTIPDGSHPAIEDNHEELLYFSIVCTSTDRIL